MNRHATKIGFLALAILTFTSCFTCPAWAQTMKVNIEIPALEIEADNDVSRLTMDGFGFTGDDGDPILPTRAYTVILPPDADQDSVEVVLGSILEHEEFVGGVAHSTRTATSDGEGGSVVLDREDGVVLDEDGKNPFIYGRDTYYPESVLGGWSTSEYQGWKLLTFTVHPVSYNDSASMAKVVDSLSVDINYQTEDSDVSVLMTDHVRDITELNQVQTYAQIKSLYEGHIRESLHATLTADDAMDLTFDAGADYLILTTEAIWNDRADNGLEDFIAHKRLLGHQVQPLAVEAIYAQGYAGDQQRQIKSHLYLYYRSGSVKNLLLVGNPDPNPLNADPGVVPMRRVLVNNEACLTDMYYSDYSQYGPNYWDADGDGSLEVNWKDSGIGYPSWNVGRVAPVGGYITGTVDEYGTNMRSDTAQTKLKAVFDKIIKYDRQLDKSWRYNMLALGSWLSGIGKASDYGRTYGNSIRPLSKTIDEIIKLDHKFTDCIVSQDGTRYADYVPDMWHDGSYANPEAYADLVDNYGNSQQLNVWVNKAGGAYEGFGFVFWSLHGSAHSASIGGGGKNDVDTSDGTFICNKDAAKHLKLDNDHPAIVYAASCNNFRTGGDLYTVGEEETELIRWSNLAHSMLFHGAVSVVAATGKLYFVSGEPKDYPVGYDVSYQREFYSDLARGKSFGKAYMDGKRAAYNEYQGKRVKGITLKMWTRLNFLGDPSQKLFTDMPDDQYDQGEDQNDTMSDAVGLYYGLVNGTVGASELNIEVEAADLVSKDHDWFCLRGLGSGEKDIEVVADYDVDWEDLDIKVYDESGHVIQGQVKTGYNYDAVWTNDSGVTNDAIYIRIIPSDYAIDYDLKVKVSGEYQSVNRIPGLTGTGGILN